MIKYTKYLGKKERYRLTWTKRSGGVLEIWISEFIVSVRNGTVKFEELKLWKNLKYSENMKIVLKVILAS